MCGIKISLQDFALKMQRRLMREVGGAYLRDTTDTTQAKGNVGHSIGVDVR